MNRGGSWNNNGQNCRSANRNRNEPSNENNNLGFRLAAAPRAGMDFPQGPLEPAHYQPLRDEGKRKPARRPLVRAWDKLQTLSAGSPLAPGRALCLHSAARLRKRKPVASASAEHRSSRISFTSQSPAHSPK